ncbi:MAG TPA: hypothetical protein PLJ75_13000, partial [Spirochaetota bacterium]|nr:hypothetical protein [Spirochaetota bacterium]
ENKTKPFHSMKTIVFIGVHPGDVAIKQPYQLFKIQNASIIIPYMLENNTRHYIFIPSDSYLDLIPCMVEYANDIASFISFVKKGIMPDFIIINSELSNDDSAMIQSLCPSSHVEIAGQSVEPPNNDSKRAVDAGNIDINLLSNNPVFLARVHLRNLDLPRVKQILLDMDLSESDAQYIIAFLNTMLQHSQKEELHKHLEKLNELKHAYEFYYYCIAHDDHNVKQLIEKADKKDLVTFQTLIQKVKLLFPTKEENLRFVDFENYIWEKNNER